MVSIILIPVVVVAVIIFLVIGLKTNPQEGGNDLIKNVYIYLVLFATLMMVIGGCVAAFMAVADIVFPTPYYQSFTEYRQFQDNRLEEPNNDDLEKLSEEELKERYDAMVDNYRRQEISRAKNSLIKSFGWIIIPLPIFIYFQRKLA